MLTRRIRRRSACAAHAAPVALALLGLSACSHSSARTGATRELSRPWAAPRTWRVEPRPVTDVGDPLSPTASRLSGNIGALRISRNRIAAGDFAGNVVRLYDTTGAFLGNAGANDLARAQIRYLSRIVGCPNGDWLADDRSLNRVVVFDSLARYLREFTPQHLFARVELRACVSGQRVLFESRDASVTLREGLQRRKLWLTLVNSVGQKLADSIDMGSIEIFSDHRVHAYLERPFANRTLFEAGANHVYAAGADDSTFTSALIGSSASVVFVVHPFRSRKIEAGDIRSGLIHYELRHDPRAPMDDYLVREVPYRNRAPALRAMVADGPSGLWLRGWEPAQDSAARWLALDSLGTAVADVELPKDFEPLQVGRDFVLGYAFVGGISHVQLLRLHR